MKSTFFRDGCFNSGCFSTKSFLFSAMLLSPIFFIASAVAQENDSKNPNVGIALDSIFDIRRAPQAKSMGLLRGSFLDALSPKQKLQVAFVVDTTESMESQISSIRDRLPNMIADLARLVDGNIESTAVTVSDIGSRGTPIQFLSPTFMSSNLFSEAISKLTTSDGRPYFYEPVDQGIHTAIQRLPWSDEDNVQKWIIFLGDAPPYEPGFVDEKTKAKRWYQTDELVELANQKNIKIHCILCKSREKESQAFEKSHDRTQEFMGRLSSETGGLMLDTSYSQVQQQLAASARRNRTEYSRVGMISEAEIKDIRDQLAPEQAETGIKRIAILPFYYFHQMKFDESGLERQLSTELRKYFRLSSNLRMTKPREIEKAVERLRVDEIPSNNWPQALCLRLRVDYLVYGYIPTKQNSTSVMVFVHDQKNGKLAVRITATGKPSDLGKTIVAQLANTVNEPDGYKPLKNHLSQLAKEQNFQNVGDGLLDLTDGERSELYAAIEEIEKAIDYSSGNPEGTKMLMEAEKKLNAILQTKPKQPFVYSMLASCKFNLSKSLESIGKEGEAKNKFTECKDSLKEAYLLRDELSDPISQLEIAADYNLLVRKDYSAAVKFYQQIANQNQTSPIHYALRAHWMLAGIRSGDWGTATAAPNEVNPKAARNHLVAILVHWPESSEANSIRRNLRWNEKDGSSQTPYFPLEGDLLTQK